jgi:hypothetical protein
MNLRQLRQSCAAKVRALDLPSPFDVQAFCHSVEHARGRTIRLVPRALPTGSPSGLCVSTKTSDYIFYEAQTSPLHQEHIILHEVAHLICEHQAFSASHHEVSQLLLPDLDPQVVQRVLGRTSYPMWAEQEAEMIASLILANVGRPPLEAAWPVPSDVAPVVARLERSLRGSPRSRMRLR